MKAERDKAKTCYLQDTAVENIFINEYMPDAPCDFVKVYLLALMYAGMEQETCEEEIAKTLMMSHEDVKRAFDYWCRAGIIKKTPEGFRFISLKEQLYGNSNEDVITPDKSRRLMNDEKIMKMFDSVEQSTRTFLQPQEMQEILGWITDFDTNSEIISEAYKYCAGLGKTNMNYVRAVVRNWASKGFQTKEDIEEYLGEMDQHYSLCKRVMKALGFSRNATEKERRIIGLWADELGCSVDQIIEACGKTSGISNPNINYVDSVLRGKGPGKKAGRPSRNLVMEYYEKMRAGAQAAAEKRREDVYNRIPQIKAIDDEIRDINMELTRSLIGGDRSRQEPLRKQLSDLEKERAMLLAENRIAIDYMDVRYNCRICQDTGITKSGERCSCYEEAARAAMQQSQSL